ncbi:MAG: hypothetical protein ACR2J9_06420 [Gaiellales bacterium]
MRRLPIVLALLACGAIVPTVAAGSSSNVCTGIDQCTVAPAQPVAVAVSLGTATYTVSCPSGTTAVAAQTVTQPGTYVVPSALFQGPLGFMQASGTMTYSAVPTVTTASSAAVTLMVGATNAPLVQYAGDGNSADATGAGLPIYPVNGTVPGGAGSGALPTQTATATLVTGAVTFTATPPNFPNWEEQMPGGNSGNNSWSYWNALGIAGPTVSAAATFSPTVACAADSRKLGAAVSSHRVAEFGVHRGVQEHRIWCPAATRRRGIIGHSVFLEGRARLTPAERRAIASRYVGDSAGRGHVETRIGGAAPGGLRVQLHADCVPTG